MEERKKAANLGKGHHDTVVDKLTSARSFNLDNTTVPDTREAALPTSKSEPPPPGPEGSPVRAKSLRLMSYKERSKMGDPEAMSFGLSDAKSVTCTEFSDDQSRSRAISTAQRTNESIIPEGKKQLLNLFLFGEVVREEAFRTLYKNFETDTFEKNYIPHKKCYIKPHVPLLEEDGIDVLARGKPLDTVTDDEKDRMNELICEICSEIFRDLINSTEFREDIKSLPAQPRRFLYAEVREKPAIYSRLSYCFQALDLDNDGTLSAAELKQGFLQLGIKGRSEMYKKIMKDLDKDGDGQVDIREFVTALPLQFRNTIEDALDLMDSLRDEEDDKLLKARQKSKRRIIASDEMMVKASWRNSKKTKPIVNASVNKKQIKESLTDDQKEASAATKISGLFRQKQARAEMNKAKSIKAFELGQKQGLLMEDCESILMDTMEETLANLMQESMKGEFDSHALPKQYFLPADDEKIVTGGGEIECE